MILIKILFVLIDLNIKSLTPPFVIINHVVSAFVFEIIKFGSNSSNALSNKKLLETVP